MKKKRDIYPGLTNVFQDTYNVYFQPQIDLTEVRVSVEFPSKRPPAQDKQSNIRLSISFRSVSNLAPQLCNIGLLSGVDKLLSHRASSNIGFIMTVSVDFDWRTPYLMSTYKPEAC